jgi:6-pyruvoyltetrahydropterin/6-carboxytetrahydropterin synthase
MDLSVEFHFAAAHQLHKSSGRCRFLHGHNYRAVVTLRGEPDPEMGWVVDFDEVHDLVQREVIDVVDGRNLNEMMEYPTAEAIARWIWERVHDHYAILSEVRLWETPAYSVTYRGPASP